MSVRTLAIVGAALALAACASAVNLEVQYKDVVGVDADGGEGGAAPVTAAPAGASELEACPCDRAQGLSCCVSAVGPAFCTSDRARCESEQGAFYGCFGPDAMTESVCCWHGAGALAVTALAGQCKPGSVAACTTATDCAAGESCQIVDCGGVKIGGCGQAPTCPPGTAR